MFRVLVPCVAMLFVAVVASGEEPEKDKLLSGMSILGNDDAPKSLVIVPWKSSVLGDPLALSRILDNGRRPVDREVFMRELAYYEVWAASQTLQGARAK